MWISSFPALLIESTLCECSSSEAFFGKHYCPQRRARAHTHPARQLLWAQIILSMSNFNDTCHQIRFGFNKWGRSGQAECSSLTPCMRGTARHQADASCITSTAFMVRSGAVLAFVRELHHWAAAQAPILKVKLFCFNLISLSWRGRHLCCRWSASESELLYWSTRGNSFVAVLPISEWKYEM